MTGRVILCALLCTGCSHYFQSLTDLSGRVQDDLHRGEPALAMPLARQGALIAASYGNTEWQWKFRYLQAEAFNQQGKAPAAFSLLAEDIPARFATSELAVRVYLDRAISQMLMNQLKEARASLDSAAVLCNRKDNQSWLPMLSLRRGILESLYDNGSNQAETYLREAIALGRKYQQPYVVCTAMANLGSILTAERHFGRAMEWVVQGTAMARQLGNRRQLEMNLANWGYCLYNLGDPESALIRLREAERLASDLNLPLHQEASLTVIGFIYSDREEPRVAATYHERGLALARQSNNPSAIAECLHNLAIDAFDSGDLERTARFNREEIRLKEASGTPSEKLYARYVEGFIAERRQNYAEAESAFQQVVSQTGNNLSLRWQAQAWLAKTHVANKQPELAERDFEDVLDTLQEGRQQLSSEEFKIKFRAALNRYYGDYIRFLMDQDRYLDALNVAEFSRAQVLFERLGIEEKTRLDLKDLQQKARSLNATILSYWLAPHGSYLWVITAEQGLVALQLPPGPEITRLAEEYRNSIASASKLTGTRLYEAILQKAHRYIPPGGRVVIIPDGNLYQVNFETLLVPGDSDPHYFIEDAVVSTATSLALMHPAPRPVNSGKILLIGAAASPGPEFPSLPHAASELHSIAARFSSNFRLLEGSAARPSAYGDSKPEKFSWIHFAAHAVAGKESPMDSAIILSNEGDSHSLFARDIERIPLKADLVTISSCYGSGTHTYAGEGIVGLAWAFLFAGAHNVIAALWEADDFYTAQLMDRVYERLKAGDDAAHSLRNAKLGLLHSEYASRNPRYWGAFQLYTGY